MSEQVPSIKAQVRNLVLEAAAMKGLKVIADDESLLQNGAVDSMSMYWMIAFLEDTFSLLIADDEMVPENFESINRIESFVTAKLQKPAT
jgi:acyl carrier protein